MNQSSPGRSMEILGHPGFWRLALSVFLFNAGYSIYIFSFNFYLAAGGLHEARMGALASAMVLGGVLGALPAAQAANRWGSARALAGFLALCALLLALRLLAAPVPVQWCLALLSGLFLSGWTVLIFPLIAAVTPEHNRPAAFQILYGLATGAGCIGALAGGYLPALCMHSLASLNQMRALAFCLLAAAALVLLPTLLLATLPCAAAEAMESTPYFRPSRRMLVLLAVSLVWAFWLGALNPFSGIFFQARFQMDLPAIGGFFFVVQGVVAAVLMLVGISRMARISSWALLAAAQLLVALSFAGMAMRWVRMAQAAYLLFMLAQQLSQPALQSILLGGASETGRNRIAAWNTMLTAGAQAVAAQVFGLLWNCWGYGRVLPYLAAATALSAAGTALVLRTRLQACS